MKRKYLSILLILLLSISLVACGSDDKNVEELIEDEPKVEEIEESIEKEETIVHDNLQELYLKFDDVTKEEIEKEVEESGLVFSEQEYSSGPSIKIALTEGVSKHKHADEGDNIKISFNKELEIENVTYFNHEKFLSLIDYRKGTYWDFRDQPEYEGYYISSPGKELGSFIVKYDNGNEAETGYIKVDSKEEQLNFLNKYKQ